MTTEEQMILTQCMKAAIEGPFFKGIFFGESEFPSIVGPDWDQLSCIMKFWPDLDSSSLHREFESLEEKYLPYRVKRPDGTLYSSIPTKSQIYGVVRHCFCLLTNEMLRPQDAEKRVLADAAWEQYVNVTPITAHEVCDQWWHLVSLSLKNG